MDIGGRHWGTQGDGSLVRTQENRPLVFTVAHPNRRHCEEQRDAAIQTPSRPENTAFQGLPHLDCHVAALLAMTVAVEHEGTVLLCEHKRTVPLCSLLHTQTAVIARSSATRQSRHQAYRRTQHFRVCLIWIATSLRSSH